MRLQINFINKNMFFYEDIKEVNVNRHNRELVFYQDTGETADWHTFSLEGIYEFYIDNRVYAVNYTCKENNNE